MAEPLRILIVDDHEVVREGLAAALSADSRFEIVGAAGNAETALELARREVPDAAIVDLRLPGITGEELCRQLRALLPELAVVVLSSYLTEESVRSALSAGATAYVTKAAGLGELRAVLTRLSEEGGQPADVASASQVVKHLEGLVEERADERAPTPQQSRVLQLAAEGLTYREIADRLLVSESTVRFHIQNLKIKLGASSKTALIVLGIRTGLIASPEEEASGRHPHGAS